MRLGIAFFNYGTSGLRDSFMQPIANWEGEKEAWCLLAVSRTCGTLVPAMGMAGAGPAGHAWPQGRLPHPSLFVWGKLGAGAHLPGSRGAQCVFWLTAPGHQACGSGGHVGSLAPGHLEVLHSKWHTLPGLCAARLPSPSTPAVSVGFEMKNVTWEKSECVILKRVTVLRGSPLPLLARLGFNPPCPLTGVGEGRLGLPWPFSSCPQSSSPAGNWGHHPALSWAPIPHAVVGCCEQHVVLGGEGMATGRLCFVAFCQDLWERERGLCRQLCWQPHIHSRTVWVTAWVGQLSVCLWGRYRVTEMWQEDAKV